MALCPSYSSIYSIAGLACNHAAVSNHNGTISARRVDCRASSDGNRADAWPESILASKDEAVALRAGAERRFRAMPRCVAGGIISSASASPPPARADYAPRDRQRA